MRESKSRALPFGYSPIKKPRMVRIVKRREGSACRELHLASKLDFYRVIGLGAARRTQTLDLLLTRQPLYQLSYDGIMGRFRPSYFACRAACVNFTATR